ncbi:MAG: hypothetical protein RLZZ144_884, partial [Pseudomonadota bacterium]
MTRAYYAATIECFVNSSNEEILGRLTLKNDFALIQAQRDAWITQIEILRVTLLPYGGSVYFEYSIPRMGRRIDVVAVIKSVIF